jgi:hypothetical protein
MFDSWPYFVGMSVLLVLLCLLAPPLLAARKGYAWYLWTIACGLLGLIVLAFLPYANNPKVDEKVNRSRRQTGDTVGGVLSAIGLLGIPYLALPALWAIEARPVKDITWVSRSLETLLILSPGLLVDLVGLVLALVWWRRHPGVSLLMLVAIGLWLSLAIGGSFLFAWLPEHLREERGWSFAQISALLDAIAMIRNSIGAAAMILLLVAIFGGRSRRERSQWANAEDASESSGIKSVERL